jgi:hypothetical protein
MTQQRNAPFFVPGEKIILTRHGVWLADGIEVTHHPTRVLFAKNLRKDSDGYFIQVGYEAKRIIVEDTPYFIHSFQKESDGGIILFLNDETQEKLRPDTLKYLPARLTCLLHRGEEAKFLHAAYFDLLKDLEEDETSYYLTLITLGKSARITLSSKKGS